MIFINSERGWLLFECNYGFAIIMVRELECTSVMVLYIQLWITLCCMCAKEQLNRLDSAKLSVDINTEFWPLLHHSVKTSD